jgi:hypothetical protein
MNKICRGELMMEAIHNRRRYFRFNAEKGLLRLMKSHSKENLGKLLNLSYGGLAYQYMHHMAHPDNVFQLDMFSSDNKVPLLNGVSTEIIYDFDASEIFQVDSGSYRLCGLKFTYIGAKQKYEIEYCIKKYTLIKQYMN